MNLKFNRGEVTISSLKVFLFPNNYWINLFNIIYSSNPKIFNKMLFESSNEDGRLLSKNSVQLLEVIKIINSFGIGNIQIKKINSEKYFLKIEENFSNRYSKIFSNEEPINLNYLMLGILNGWFNNQEKKLNIKEIKKMNKITTYEITTHNTQNTNPTFSNYDIKKDKSRIYPMLKSVLVKGNLNYKKNELYLFKISASIFPIKTIINIISSIDEKSCQKIIQLGYTQGSIASQMHNKKFGVTNNKKIINNIISLSDISGLGRFSLIKKNFKAFNFSYSPSYTEFKNNSEYDILFKHILEIMVGSLEEANNKTFKVNLAYNGNIEISESSVKIRKKKCKTLNIDNF